MGSMMAPSIALDGDGVALAAGAAGGTRLRGALLQVVAGILDEELEAEEAVSRPRLHAAAGRAQLEPGFSEAAIEALERRGWDVRVWPSRHHYFGGVSVVSRGGSAGDVRRSGSAKVLQ
jgi:gamma-glutamyltranspeptidase/glutathione hydrolase